MFLRRSSLETYWPVGERKKPGLACFAETEERMEKGGRESWRFSGGKRDEKSPLNHKHRPVGGGKTGSQRKESITIPSHQPKQKGRGEADQQKIKPAPIN